MADMVISGLYVINGSTKNIILNERYDTAIRGSVQVVDPDYDEPIYQDLTPRVTSITFIDQDFFPHYEVKTDDGTTFVVPANNFIARYAGKTEIGGQA